MEARTLKRSASVTQPISSMYSFFSARPARPSFSPLGHAFLLFVFHRVVQTVSQVRARDFGPRRLLQPRKRSHLRNVWKLKSTHKKKKMKRECIHFTERNCWRDGRPTLPPAQRAAPQRAPPSGTRPYTCNMQIKPSTKANITTILTSKERSSQHCPTDSRGVLLRLRE